MRRIEADEKGKRDAGLAAWQCRRCSKKSRVDPPAAAPVRVLETNRAHQPTPAQRDGSSVDATRTGVIRSAAPTASTSLNTSRNPGTQATSGRPTTAPSVIAIDDDIEMIDMSSPVVVPPTPVPAHAPVKPPSQINLPEVLAPSTSAAPAAEGLPSKPTPNVTLSYRQTHVLGKAAESARGRQVYFYLPSPGALY